MKSTCFFSKSVLTGLVVLVVSLVGSTVTEAQQSPVQFAGIAQYKLVRKGKVVNATASIDQVINNSPYSFSDTRVVLALAKKAYTPGATIGVSTIASTSLGFFPSFTYQNNIQLSGSGRALKGKKIRVVLLVVDEASRILGGLTFSKSLKMKAVPLSAQALGLDRGSEHLVGKLVEVRH